MAQRTHGEAHKFQRAPRRPPDAAAPRLRTCSPSALRRNAGHDGGATLPLLPTEIVIQYPGRPMCWRLATSHHAHPPFLASNRPQLDNRVLAPQRSIAVGSPARRSRSQKPARCRSAVLVIATPQRLLLTRHLTRRGLAASVCPAPRQPACAPSSPRPPSPPLRSRRPTWPRRPRPEPPAIPAPSRVRP